MKQNDEIEEMITTEAGQNTELEGSIALSINDQVSANETTEKVEIKNVESQNGEKLTFQEALQAEPHDERQNSIVFEGKMYTKKVFDEALNDYVYIADESEEPRGELLM